MSLVYIGLGSNLNEPLSQLKHAVASIRATAGITLTAASSYYRTQPWGGIEQPDFINAVIAIETELSPIALLHRLRAIEIAQGRIRAQQQYGPRVIDLDILLYDDRIMSTDELVIPHPQLTQRDFVLYPLAEIAPRLCLPGGESVQQLKAAYSAEHIQLLKE